MPVTTRSPLTQRLLFALNFFRHPFMLGSIWPSSRYLVDEVLRPKILGLAVLEQIFADRELDFFALFSSVAALWGREGQVDYAAANAYLDSYAVRMWEKAKWPVVSINWDTWREVGMAINTLRVAPGQAKPKVLKFGLGTDEGIRAFTQALVKTTRASEAMGF